MSLNCQDLNQDSNILCVVSTIPLDKKRHTFVLFESMAMCYAVPGPASKLCPQSSSEALWMFAYRQTGRTSLSLPC